MSSETLVSPISVPSTFFLGPPAWGFSGGTKPRSPDDKPGTDGVPRGPTIIYFDIIILSREAGYHLTETQSEVGGTRRQCRGEHADSVWPDYPRRGVIVMIQRINNFQITSLTL